MTLATLIIGGRASEREAAIAAAIDPDMDTALILEGLPDGVSALESGSESTSLLMARNIVRIAPGCPCCSGNLTMRVTLNRILRRPPARLFISLASMAHLEKIHNFLRSAPYDKFLVLTQDFKV